MIDGWSYFGYRPAEGQSDADMGRRRAEVFLDLLRGEGFAQPNPRPMFSNPPGLLRVEPHSEGLRERIWWGAGSNATAVWAAKLGVNLQSSTLKEEETGEPFHVQQAAQIRAFRAAWKEAGHAREPRVSVSRSIFALLDDRDHAYFGRGGGEEDQVGFIDEKTRAIFGRSYAAEPDVLVEQLKRDEAIAEAATLLLTVPNQLVHSTQTLRGAPLTDPRTRHRRSDMTSSSVGRYSPRFGDRCIGRFELIEPPAERVGNRKRTSIASYRRHHDALTRRPRRQRRH